MGRAVLVVAAMALITVGAYPRWRHVGWGVSNEQSVVINSPAGRACVLTDGPDLDSSESFAGRVWPQIDAGAVLAEAVLIIGIATVLLVLVSPATISRETAGGTPDQ